MAFDLFDSDGWLVDAEYAAAFAGGGADAAGEFGEVIGSREDLVGFFPLLAVDGVIEFGDDVAQGASVVTEGMPQFMQRADWLLSSWPEYMFTNSL